MVNREDYSPYHKFAAFKEGEESYKKRSIRNPHDPNSVHAQAWDRGAEFAMESSLQELRHAQSFGVEPLSSHRHPTVHNLSPVKGNK